jgi:hypothetical protein
MHDPNGAGVTRRRHRFDADGRAGMRCVDHQPSPDVHPDVMDGAGVPGNRREEDEVARQQVRDRDRRAAVRMLVRGHPGQQYACLFI